MSDDEGVTIRENVVVETAQYLAEIGRLGSRTSKDVFEAIQRGVNSQWGTAKVPRFRDDSGIGWVLDISEWFGDEVLYAVVRRRKGEPFVTQVVTEDKLRDMLPKKKPSNPPPPDPSDPEGPPPPLKDDVFTRMAVAQTEVQRLQEEVEQLQAKLDAATKNDPEKPALVRYTRASVGDDDKIDLKNFEDELTIKQVGGRVQELIDSGIKAEQIVVWTERKQPKVRIEIE